jgi:hypothetical protein
MWGTTCENKFFVSHWTHICWLKIAINFCNKDHAANVTRHISNRKHHMNTSHFNKTLQTSHHKYHMACITFKTSCSKHHKTHITFQTTYCTHQTAYITSQNITMQISHFIDQIPNNTLPTSHSNTTLNTTHWNESDYFLCHFFNRHLLKNVSNKMQCFISTSVFHIV